MARKRTKSLFVLNILSKESATFSDLVVSLALLPLTKSYKGVAPLIRLEPRESEETATERRRLSVLLARLKKEGLISSQEQNGVLMWSITSKGNALKDPPKERYEKKVGKEAIVVSYDIPEKLKRERNWLRGVLKLLGLEMVHRSLWIGTIVLPELFFQELDERKLLSHVHAFAIGKEGTLKKL